MAATHPIDGRAIPALLVAHESIRAALHEAMHAINTDDLDALHREAVKLDEAMSDFLCALPPAVIVRRPDPTWRDRREDRDQAPL